ncbi:MAG TPA: hypothetical protein VJS45_05335, partial [Acidimicrobiia bacterium]|nr:hypothetical protein [Acidimicrobiia bacterium]
MQLDTPTTDLQPERVHGPGRRLTPGSVLAPPATFAAGTSTALATGTAPTLARAALATRTAPTLATRTAPTLATRT